MSYFKDLDIRVRTALAQSKHDSNPEYWDRLNTELRIIDETGQAAIVLEYEKLANEAKRSGVVGPGFGAASSSLVYYLLGITNIDPVRFGLKYERYLFSVCPEDDLYLNLEVDDLSAARIEELIPNQDTEFPRIMLTSNASLRVLQDACRRISDDQGVEVDLREINLNDSLALKQSREFLLEEIDLHFDAAEADPFTVEMYEDIQDLLYPKHFKEAVAFLALCRPACIESGPTLEYFMSRQLNIHSINLAETPISLEETYGCIIYQEQLLELLQKLGGFSPFESDAIRRDISKGFRVPMGYIASVGSHFTKEHIIEKWTGSAFTHGLSSEFADELWQYLVEKSGYYFLKAHAVSRAMLCVQKGWLKAHFPREYQLACKQKNAHIWIEHQTENPKL